MNAELRKRLEEAANNYAYITATSIKERWMEVSDIYRIIRNAHAKGAEHGYRKAIAQCKEWMEKHIPCIHTHEGDAIYVHGFRHIPMASFLAEFESDMNKLWEEKK